MTKIRIAALLFVITSAQFLFAQRYSFVQYSTEEGLPQSQVTSICQDDKGYLWVSTLGGLAKFNGDKFSTYSTDNGLLNNRVSTVAFFDDRIWVGHDGGLTIIHNETFKRIAFEGEDKSRNVSKILKFQDRIIICSNGAGLFELEGDKLSKIELDEAFLRVRDAQVVGGEVYFATKNGLLTSKDLVKFQLIADIDSISLSGVRANDELVIVSSYTGGLFVKEIDAVDWKKSSAEDVGVIVTGCMLDGQNNIWLSSQSGVQLRDLDGKVRTYDEKNGLPVNMISCFYEDRDGYVWIGSQGKGLFRFPGTKFEYYDQSTGLPTDLFLGGFQKANGDYYLGTYAKGLILRSLNGDVRQINTGRYYIWASLEGVNGSDWFSTEASLIELKKNGKVIEYDQSSEIPGSKITALYKAGPNTMYIGGNEGVSVYENGTFKKLGPADLDAMGTVRDFEEYEGKIYCTSNLGLFVSENKNDFYLYKDFNSVVYNIEKDQLGNLWLGTEEGLYRIRDEKIERIDLLDDPASNYINFINYLLEVIMGCLLFRH
jgi:ligand-binding sensor domain-containing protein